MTDTPPPDNPDPPPPDPMAYFVVADNATGAILQSGYCVTSDLQHQAKDGQTMVQLTPEQVGVNGKSFRYDVGAQQFVQIMTDLQQAQASKVANLKTACDKAIVGGFSSSALGSAHDYPSTLTDQSNMLRASIAGGDLMCAVAGVWSLSHHTSDQAKAALTDFGTTCDADRAHLADLTSQVNAATDIQTAMAITW